MELQFLDKVRFKKDIQRPGIDSKKVYVLLGIENDGFVTIEQDKLGTCAVQRWHGNPCLLEKI